MKNKRLIVFSVLSIFAISLCILNYTVRSRVGDDVSINNGNLSVDNETLCGETIEGPAGKPLNIPKVTVRTNNDKSIFYALDESSESEFDEVDKEPEVYEELDAIKKKIYDINVEYIEDVELLDVIVDESAGDPPELWGGDWVSVDDWKRADDVFNIEKQDDGSFRLMPERDAARSYSFDEEKGEFIREVDYYGKTITHKAKFISSDVMVLMKISGVKVALDIYTREAG